MGEHIGKDAPKEFKPGDLKNISTLILNSTMTPSKKPFRRRKWTEQC
jgi:hypothetical protein